MKRKERDDDTSDSEDDDNTNTNNTIKNDTTTKKFKQNKAIRLNDSSSSSSNNNNKRSNKLNDTLFVPTANDIFESAVMKRLKDTATINKSKKFKYDAKQIHKGITIIASLLSMPSLLPTHHYLYIIIIYTISSPIHHYLYIITYIL